MLIGSALASLSAASPSPRDPRRTLTSLGVVVYDWDLAADAITWGPNAAEVIGHKDVAAWSTGRAFARAVAASDGATRAEVIAQAEASDAGTGVAFAATYRLTTVSGRTVTVDDTGRWFADANGTPASVHGTMRLRRSDGQPSDASRERTGFLAQVSADLIDANQAKRPLTVFAIAIGNLRP